MLSQPLLEVSFSAFFGKKFQRSLKILKEIMGKLTSLVRISETSFGPLYSKQKLQPLHHIQILMGESEYS